MKRKLLLVLMLGGLHAYCQTPANDPHWRLEWEDHFNTLDLNRWDVKNHFDHYGEPQVYTNRPDNIFVNSGNLALHMKQELYSCPQSAWHFNGCRRESERVEPYKYTSAMLDSKRAYNIKFGYLEARIKLSHGMGFFPAFWTFRGDGVQAPVNSGEIDIFEALGHLPPNQVATNVHTQTPDIIHLHEAVSPANFNYTDWHTYGVEWSNDKIIWYIDGCPVRLLTNHNIVDPARIILNFALYGDFPPDASTPFPSDMLVDYVKVYQLKSDCSTVINACNYNFGTHDHRVKKEIIIGNGSCTNAVSPGQNVFLRASENIVIHGDFTVPIGAQFYMDVNECY